MILVTVGGAKEFQFERLLRIIDELVSEGLIKGSDIIAQIGFNSYKPKNYKSFDFISKDEFKNIVAQCDYIISHAGVGTVVDALKNQKKIILFPRLGKYKEHVDDHQLDFCNLCEEKGYCLVAKNKDELKDCIKKICFFIPIEYHEEKGIIELLIIDEIEKNS